MSKKANSYTKNSDTKMLYFIGIGGIGMSALARYYLAQGKKVAGYDRSESAITKELIQLGAEIIYEDKIELIPQFILENHKAKNDCTVIFTPAIPQDSNLLNYFKNANFQLIKRSKALGEITNAGKTIAVAGTHGKTTTSTLIAHIFKTAEIDFTAFLGGISSNYNSNYILGGNKLFVVEADEFDRSFLSLFPDHIILTSMDADHLDIYKSKANLVANYQEFIHNLKPEGKLFSKFGLLVKTQFQQRHFRYGEKGDFSAQNIRIENGNYVFDFLSINGKIENVICGLPGIHNVENAVAAMAVAQEFEISDEVLKKAIHSFKGVKRRFEYHIKTKDLIFIDDYAHHPTEIKMLIQSVRKLYPNKKITGIFQPHLYSRTQDFMDEFAKSLAQLDELFLLDIYPAREKPIEGVSSKELLNKIALKNKKLITKEELLKSIKPKQIEVILTIGAGDIDQLVSVINEQLSVSSK